MLKTISAALIGGGGNGTVTNVATGTGLTGGPITTTGTIALANTSVTAGTYGNASTVAQVTINAQGQATNVVNVAISIANSAVTGLGTMSTQNANSVAITGGAIDGTTIGSTTVAAGSFTTLNSSGATRLGGLSGNQSLQVNNVAGAVNYAQIVGASTTGTPLLSAQGTDANIGLVLTGKGTGAIVLNGTTTSRTVQIDSVAGNTTVYTQFTRNVGINEQQISATGDANLGLLATGGGAVNLRTGGGSLQAVVSPTASAVNYVNLTGAVTTAAPEISAQGSDANINLKLTPKGTGIVQTAAALKSTGVIAGLSTKTANYTLVATDHTVLGNATTASFSLTLPTSVGATGQNYIVKKIDSTANTVTILTTSSQTIDGSASKVLSSQYDGFQLQSDGANWMIIGNIFGRNGTTGTF